MVGSGRGTKLKVRFNKGWGPEEGSEIGCIDGCNDVLYVTFKNGSNFYFGTVHAVKTLDTVSLGLYTE